MARSEVLAAFPLQHAKHKARKLFGIILDLTIKVARHEGYIARVTDLDPAGVHSGVTSEPAADLDDMLRHDLADAKSETMRDRIIESADLDMLDRALGRDPISEDRFLRRGE